MRMSYALRTRATRVLVTLAVIALTVSGFRASTAASVVPEKMSLVTENECLSLYMDPRTAEVAVLDKRSGSIWYTNPIDRDRMETVARGTAKKALGSQLSISYFTPDDLRKTADAFNESIEYGQFEIVSIDHGVRVQYVLGRKWKAEDYLPVMVDKDRFESLILDRVGSKSDRQLLLSNYYLISLQPLLEQSQDSYSEDLLGAYRLVLHEPLTGEVVGSTQNDLFERVASQTVKYNDAVKSRSDLKRQHFEHLVESPTYVLSNSAIKWDLTDIQEIVKKAGYSPEEIQQDHRTHGLNEPVPNPEVFEIAIEYILDGDNLVVRIPTSEIVYPRTAIARDGEVVGFPLCTVSVLQYFGAADREQSGYMFVPDGSGALIYLNNGKTSASQYLRPVYGSNGSLAPIREAITVEEQVFLPVFGMKSGDQAFLAIIESGDATARTAADVAGRSDSYNKVYAQFVLIPQAQTTLKGDVSNKFSITNMKVQTRMNVYQSRMCLEDIVIRYCFLHGDDADYMGMAECYRNYLVEKGALTRLTTSGDIPLYLEVVGAATRQRPIKWESFWKITFPMLSPLLLTNVVYTIIDSFTSPSNTLVELIRNTAFGGGAGYGVSTAMACLYFLAVSVVMVIAIAIISPRVYYQQ